MKTKALLLLALMFAAIIISNAQFQQRPVEAAGGKFLVPKTQISTEYGYMAVIADTEGNRIALIAPRNKS